MSLAEIKDEIAKLSAEELSELKRDLLRGRFDDPAFVAALTVRNREAERGEHLVSDDEFRAKIAERVRGA